MAAIAVIGSGTGTGDDSRSENHSESIALFSHVSTKRQKKSAFPSGPSGHGPGITPTRYLMSTMATLSPVVSTTRHSRRAGIHSRPGARGAWGAARGGPPCHNDSRFIHARYRQTSADHRGGGA